jgi:hypothetical protein
MLLLLLSEVQVLLLVLDLGVVLIILLNVSLFAFVSGVVLFVEEIAAAAALDDDDARPTTSHDNNDEDSDAFWCDFSFGTIIGLLLPLVIDVDRFGHFGCCCCSWRYARREVVGGVFIPITGDNDDVGDDGEDGDAGDDGDLLPIASSSSSSTITADFDVAVASSSVEPNDGSSCWRERPLNEIMGSSSSSSSIVVLGVDGDDDGWQSQPWSIHVESPLLELLLGLGLLVLV